MFPQNAKENYLAKKVIEIVHIIVMLKFRNKFINFKTIWLSIHQDTMHRAEVVYNSNVSVDDTIKVLTIILLFFVSGFTKIAHFVHLLDVWWTLL